MAQVFATVGDSSKVDFLTSEFSMPRNRIFSSRDSSFYNEIMAATNGRGVDLVLNSLSGELLHTSWKCVSKFGKMLEIGKRDMVGRAQLGMETFEANRTFCGIDMVQLAEEKPKQIKKYVDFL